ncbi:LOW QUALITY PROTEIN: uncharacterized protein [Macrobrachium rosenbergii]|uniref:LOW QUALITY PROTEIN: uncharacterized protein n=1 Tax=Macrobrachium rosenbergii TaxID=79674 RepID=UPI0034D6E928
MMACRRLRPAVRFLLCLVLVEKEISADLFESNYPEDARAVKLLGPSGSTERIQVLPGSMIPSFETTAPSEDYPEGRETEGTRPRTSKLNKGSKDATELKSEAVTGVLLQADEAASIDSYVDSGQGTLPNLTEVTICVRFRLLHGGQPATLFSYYDGKVFEQLNVAIKYPNKELLVMCCAYHVHQYVKIPIRLFTWEHLCLALNIRKDTLHIIFNDRVYLNTAKRNETDSSPEKAYVKGGGRFVMGQNINLDAEWDVTQSVHGELVDFRLYNHDVPVNMMQDYVACKPDPIPFEPLYAYGQNESELILKGKTKSFSIALSEVCRPRNGYITLFPERMTFEEAFNRCNYLRGDMGVPRSKEENTRLFDELIVFNDQCIQGWAALYWLGLKSNIPKGVWQYTGDNTTLTYGSWLEGWEIPSKQYPCATAAAVNFPYLWYNADCDTLTCPVCNFTATPAFRLRGLCRESKFDRDYFLNGYRNGRPMFEGMFFSQIVWNNETWVLRSRKEKGVVAEMIERRPKGYPFGLTVWAITGDNCVVKETEYLLTYCGDNDFTCSDGSCINIVNRCDQVTHCPDNSDELNCGILQVPTGYTANLPPPSFDRGPLLMKIAVEITSVREFNLVGFSMQLDVIQSVTWKDARLTFANLRPGDFINQAGVDSPIWRPILAVKDASKSPTNIEMRNEGFRVNRESTPLSDQDTKTREDKLYAGADNSMKIVQQYTVQFMCLFRLQMYPFDTQQCLLSFNITNMEQNFIFQKVGVLFSGERRLLEYKCIKEEMLGIEDGPGIVEVVLTFRNQYGYYIGNAVVPSLLLVSICYLCFLFDMRDFPDRIMVSLTSLLVLAALFSQTSQSIPKTAYLKLIDVWYICLITYDFLIIVDLVVIENLRLQAAATANEVQTPMFVKVGASGPAGLLDEKHRQASPRDKRNAEYYTMMSNKLNFASVVLFPVLCVIFCLIFFIIGFLDFAQYD